MPRLALASFVMGTKALLSEVGNVCLREGRGGGEPLHGSREGRCRAAGFDRQRRLEGHCLAIHRLGSTG